MTLLIQLILAHLVGDFLLQPEAWVAHKEQMKIKSVYLYLHAGIHFVLILLLVQSAGFWKYALLLSCLHLLIDLLKLYKSGSNGRRWFFYDQVLHFLVLIGFWYIYSAPKVEFAWLGDPDVLVMTTAFVFITKPASVIIKVFIARWNPYTGSDARSLKSAGEWIGYIERVLTLVMILQGNWEAIGFFIAAKSVFRIGDVRDAGDKKMTEYILIGTLLSFGIAIITGVIAAAVTTHF